jgi:hypothetical protein
MKARWLVAWLVGISGLAVTAHSSAALPPPFPMCAMCAGCPAGVGACAVVNSGAELTTFETTCHDTLGCDVGPPCVQGTCAGVQGCPLTEAGQCADGVDNDANGLVDAADPNCHVHAPALTWYSMVGAGVLLLGFGSYRLRHARRLDSPGFRR